MSHPSPTRVRFALVGTFALLALGFLLPSGYAQFGRPPGGGAMGGGVRPPGGIGGIPTMPRPPLGGAPFPGAPGGGLGGMPGRLGGGIGGGRSEIVWTCTACGGELGRGPI